MDIKERKQASDYPQELLNLFDKYVHGDIDRRAFLAGAEKFAVGGVTATMIWESLKPNYAWAQQVAKDDKRIKTESATVPSPTGTGSIKGYLVRPADAGTKKLPAIIVIHENRGLNPYIEDVARRLGAAGFMAFAPDGLTSVGGYPGDEEKAAASFRTVDGAKMQNDLAAAAEWVRTRPDSTGKLGAVGFCFGGGVVNNLAVRMGSNLAAGVPFYGIQPSADDTAKIKTPLVANYAEMDDRINMGIPAFEAALKANKVEIAVHKYPGTQHGFHNDTTPRYNKEAAELAWQRTMAHFNKYVKG
jgi:carboxymethylenebutenolidase